MIGIFDSGVGGLVSANEVARLLPKEDVIFLADRENAPYGTKTKDELIKLVRADIKRLQDFGAEKILIACCTASTLYQSLTPDERKITVPIIAPAIEAALACTKNISVISTVYTKNSHAFRDEAYRRDRSAHVSEFALQELVGMVEGGCRDGYITKECAELLDSFTREAMPKDTEALILGCTHFSHLELEIAKRIPGVKIISPAKEGAKRVAEYYRKRTKSEGRGRLIFA